MKKIRSFLTGLIVFSFFPLVGWGLNEIQSFFANPFRLTFIVMMIILSGLVVIAVPNEGRGFGEGEKLVKRQKFAIRLLQIFPVILLILSPYFDKKMVCVFSESNTLRILGLLLSFFGFFFMNWSVAVLGKQFSVDVTIQNDHKLVTSGPYKYIRHPRYLGIVVFFYGIPLVFLSWIALIFNVIILAILLWRVKDEEELMLREFKEEWVDYTKRTYKLIPYVY